MKNTSSKNELQIIPSVEFKRTKIPLSEKIITKFKKLKANKQFQKFVLTYREQFGIPQQGFSDIVSAGKFFSKNQNAELGAYVATKQIMMSLSLSYSFFMPLQSYLKLGDLLPLTELGGDDYGYGSVMHYDTDGIYIQILPGASQGDVKEYMKLKWQEIEAALQVYYPEYTKRRVKNHASIEDRDFFIYDLYLMKVLKYNGMTNMEGLAKRFGSNATIAGIFKERSFKLPDIEQRKNIIRKGIRLKKIGA